MISTYYKLVKKYLAYKLLYIAVGASTYRTVDALNHSFSTKKDKHYSIE
jgi:hypothetical protein